MIELGPALESNTIMKVPAKTKSRFDKTLRETGITAANLVDTGGDWICDKLPKPPWTTNTIENRPILPIPATVDEHGDNPKRANYPGSVEASRTLGSISRPISPFR